MALRSCLNATIIGGPLALPNNKLPTCKEVLCQLLLLKSNVS